MNPFKAVIILSAVDKMTATVQNAVNRASAALRTLENAKWVANADKAGNNLAVAGGVITAAMGFSIKAAEDSEVAFNRVNQVFKSMGESTDAAARASADYASALAVQIGQEDETIMAAQAKIATFKHVSDETARMAGIYDRATAAAFDLQATGFGDAAGNAVQLGKALEDPIKGITALRKAGVTFTAEEQNKIKTLVASNKLLDAQKMVLGAVEKQVGGVAAATATDSAKMAVAIGEIAETAGAALLPVMKEIFAIVTPVVGAFRQFVEEHPGIVKAVAAIGLGMLALGVTMKAVTASISFFGAVWAAMPIIAAVAAIAAAAYLVYTYWDEIVGFLSGVWEGIKNIFRPIGRFFSAIWNGVVKVFRTYINLIKTILIALNPVTLLFAAWSKVSAFFSTLWTGIKNIFNGIANTVLGLPKTFYDAGVAMLDSLWQGIKAMAYKPIQAIKDVANTIGDYIGITSTTNLVGQAMEKAKMQQSATMQANGVMSSGAISSNAVTNNGGSSSLNYQPNITIQGGEGGVTGNLTQILKAHQEEIMRMMQKQQAREVRVSF